MSAYINHAMAGPSMVANELNSLNIKNIHFFGAMYIIKPVAIETLESVG
jgi:hypothetical protein